MSETLWTVICQIDDMNGEYYSYIMDVLLASGAKDVTYTSVYMKKNRPGIQITVLVDGVHIEDIEKILLLETTTFGLRKFPVERTVLQRELKVVNSPLGEVGIKIGIYEGTIVKVTPEYESLRVIAITLKMPLPEVYTRINAWLTKELEENRL